MKFLVDAQLPCQLANWLKESGYDAHALDQLTVPATSFDEHCFVEIVQRRLIVHE